MHITTHMSSLVCSSHMFSRPQECYPREESHLHSPIVRKKKIIIKISLHFDETGGIKRKQNLTGESSSTGDTRVRRRDKCVSALRKPNERRLPALRHQINFTLSHLPATVMSFIHPFPRSHGNYAAWSYSFFYICLSLSLFLCPSPSPDPSEPSPLTSSERYSYTPSFTSIHPLLLHYHIEELV